MLKDKIISKECLLIVIICMLLGEIVKGCYLVKVIVMMYKICCEVEVVIFYR